MGQDIVISNFHGSYETAVEPFNLNNDSFPVLEDFYIWRGRVKRKRADVFLGRLQRDLEDESIGNTSASPWSFTIYSTLADPIAGEGDAQIVPGSVEITITGPIVFTDQGDGTLMSVTAGNSGTIDYTDGSVVLTHTAGAAVATTITFSYYPSLPVMGLEDFEVGNSPEPILLSFDTKYSYGFNQGTGLFYDTTFYKQTQVPFTWNGQNYQQFWTSNWEGVPSVLNASTATGCLWTTNSNPGFHFVTATYVSGSTTDDIVMTLTSGGSPYEDLVVNDIVWCNEWASATDINGVSGTCTSIVDASMGQYTITFTGLGPTVAGAGIAQLMTNSIAGQDGIRWYDGDPTTVAPPNNNGWVNFAPPLSEYDASTNPNPLYLVGARVILPFKGRLLFGNVSLRTSASSALNYENRVVYSQVGIPFYSDPLPADIAGAPNTTAQVAAWYQNVAGRGGFVAAPISESIITWGENEDIVVTLFDSEPLKLIYTSSDALPFVFQTISAELGGMGTFSGVKLDTGLLSMGSYGFSMTTSTSVQRIDLQIPDQIFSVNQSNNKEHRITAVRDFRNEWVYFTFCTDNPNTTVFPTKTLLYNYRDNNWALFRDRYTTYGTFRRTTNLTWASLGDVYGTWANWTTPWNWVGDDAFFPGIVGGNQQGFVMQRAEGLNQEPSLFIQAVNVTSRLITSPDHGLLTGDYVEISDCIGVTGINGIIYVILKQDEDSFIVSVPGDPPTFSGTYVGGGLITPLSRPRLQTKQFPAGWGAGLQSRIGPTRFLLEANEYPSDEELELGVSLPQISAYIYAGQNNTDISNAPEIEPYLAFTPVILTCPETQTGYTAGQSAIWHRLSTSITGGTVQVELTLSDDQMLDSSVNEKEITLHALIITLNPAGILA